LDVFNSATEVRDPVAQELDRLGVRVSLPSGSVAVPGGTTRAQETAAKQQRGRTVRAALERLMASPQYQALGDAPRVEVLERLIQRARSQASTAVRRELTEAQLGERFDHPRYGRVRVAGVNPNGTIRVERLAPDGTVVGRQQIIVKAGDLSQPAATAPATSAPLPRRTAREQRALAAAKFAGQTPGPITRQELRLLAGEMKVGADALEREATARGIEVR
jgi:hypothetical protein